jgi:hypothetical protein
MDHLRYPTGPFVMEPNPTPAHRAQWISEIERAPALIRAAVSALPEGGLDKPYRPGGWTARQVVHHVADSHINSYVRFRLALTEDEPTIKTYQESRWAELTDARTSPVDVSFQLLDALHSRWVTLLRSLTDADHAKKFNHPELGMVNLTRNLALYAWHGRHHEAHIRLIR